VTVHIPSRPAESGVEGPRAEIMPQAVENGAEGHYWAGPFLPGVAMVPAAFNEPRVDSPLDGASCPPEKRPRRIGTHRSGVDLVLSRP
jgi:hypothetical protein